MAFRLTYDEIREMIVRTVCSIPMARAIVRRAGYDAAIGRGFPPGGLIYQALVKLSDDDNDVGWANVGPPLYRWDVPPMDQWQDIRAVGDYLITANRNQVDSPIWHTVEPASIMLASWHGTNTGLRSGASNANDLGFQFNPYRRWSYIGFDIFSSSVWSYWVKYGGDRVDQTTGQGSDNPALYPTDVEQQLTYPEHWTGKVLRCDQGFYVAGAVERARLQVYVTRCSPLARVLGFFDYFFIDTSGSTVVESGSPNVNDVPRPLEFRDVYPFDPQDEANYVGNHYYASTQPFIRLNTPSPGYYDSGWVDVTIPEHVVNQQTSVGLTGVIKWEDPGMNDAGIVFAEVQGQPRDVPPFFDWVFHREPPER